jgi:hypothetical protein
MSGLPAYIRCCIAAFACLVACALPATALADANTGGASPNDPEFQPHGKATLLPNGQAIAPIDAPPQVKAIIDAGNRIATLPYIYGGGHNATFSGHGYDCSGSVSYALAAAGLLSSPLDSTGFESWGDAGPGQWITVYANSVHAFMVVAGWRFDTGALSSGGTRWSQSMRDTSGFVARHPPGL